MNFEAVENEFKCLICNNAQFDTKQKLGAHQGRCKLKHPENVQRSGRVPFGAPTQRFNISEEAQKRYHYHVFNDNWRKEPGRIQRAIAAGYELVEHERSGETAGTNDDGSEIKGVLMRLPKQLYEQDQAEKQKEIDKVDEQIHQGRFKTDGPTYGGVKTETKLTG